MKSTKTSYVAKTNKKMITSLLLATALVGALSACAPEKEATPTSTTAQTKTVAPKPSATQSTSASPTPTELEGVDTGLTCEKILSTKALYSLNPNFAYVPDQSPEAGTVSAKQKSLKGITCQYVNMSGGDVIWLSVAKLAGTGSEEVKNELLNSSTPTTAFGDQPTVYGFFKTSNGIGIAEAVTGDYWISAESTWFYSVDDSIGFIRAAIASVS